MYLIFKYFKYNDTFQSLCESVRIFWIHRNVTPPRDQGAGAAFLLIIMRWFYVKEWSNKSALLTLL